MMFVAPLVLTRTLTSGVALVKPSAAADASHEQALETSDRDGSEKPQHERLAHLTQSIVDDLASAPTLDELSWRLSNEICGTRFEEFLLEAVSVLKDLLLDDIELDFPPDLQEAGELAVASTELAMAMAAAAVTFYDDQNWNEGVDGEDDHLELPDLQEILYGDQLPDAVQEAMHDGLAAHLCLLTLLKVKRLPDWLQEALKEQALQGQRRYLSLLKAGALEAGLELPISEVLEGIEPLDLKSEKAEHRRECAAVDSYLDGVASQRSSGS